MRRVFVLLACLLPFGCTAEKEYPSRPITLICPWAAGGGTDRVSRQIAMHLEQELDVPVNVINATGGKGVTGHNRGMRARPDGYTLAMITFELNTMHFSGLTDLTYQECRPLMSVNQDHAALLVRTDAPWQSLPELIQDIKQQPGALQASGTAAGGAWHLALAGWLLSEGLSTEDVVWVSSTGANPSLQELMSGGVNMVCCSLPEAASLLGAGEIRALGVMAPRRVRGYEDVPTFAEQGSDWTLGGWRGLAVPLNTPQPIVDKLVAALRRTVTGKTAVKVRRDDGEGVKTVEQTFPDFMAQEGFNNDWMGPAEFRQFLQANDKKFGELLSDPAMASVNEDPFHPLTFPGILAGLMALVGLALAGQRVWREEETPKPKAGDAAVTVRGVANFLVIVAAIAAYALFAETVGFVLMAAVLLLGALLWLGANPLASAAAALLAPPAVYHLFAIVLRVPLPQGWLGW